MRKTLVDKLWGLHELASLPSGESLLYVDRVFLHERAGAFALKMLSEDARSVRQPQSVFATVDHIIDTFPGRISASLVPSGELFVDTYREYAARLGVEIFDVDDGRQGIVHVIAAELGIALPGSTIICADSHTCSLGGLGALAWGVGTTEVQAALATRALPRQRPRQSRVTLRGMPGAKVYAKDLILALIGRYGASGGRGAVIEFVGPAVASMPIEARLTLCNMAVEFDAWTGLIAPDDSTVEYLAGRRYSPRADQWDAAVAHWKSLKTDDAAVFDEEFELDCSDLAPQITWGTSPEHVIPVNGVIPDPRCCDTPTRRKAMELALEYTGLVPGQVIEQVPIDAAFLGSCTNARVSDLREAAALLRGRKVAPGIQALCVPGSMEVKRTAEAEGLDKVFMSAGFEWREPGCSLCFFAGGDSFGQGKRIVSSTNRNFEGRQGPGNRTHLCSPATVAASAIAGRIADPRRLEVGPV